MTNALIAFQTIGDFPDTNIQLEVVIADERDSRSSQPVGLFESVLLVGRGQFVVSIADFAAKSIDDRWG